MEPEKPLIRGRGAQKQGVNRFESCSITPWFEDLPDTGERESLAFPQPDTQILPTHPKSILNAVTSPDIPAEWSLNPYQGCEHGCIYCYARNTHDYWGLDAGTGFESTILYKKNAPALLEMALRKKHHQPSPIMLAGNTDIYQPVERRLGITRKLLEVLVKYQHPVGIITKNALIMRDIDLLTRLAAHQLVHVNISITTLDEDLRQVMEPRTSTTVRRLEAVERLSAAGIPVRVMIGPVIPSLNDHEIPAIIKASAERGAIDVSYLVIRLNGHVEDLFRDWMHRVFPDRASRVLNQIAALHGGSVSDHRFGTRMRGEGPWSLAIRKQFDMNKTKYLPDARLPDYNTSLYALARDGGIQGTLF